MIVAVLLALAAGLALGAFAATVVAVLVVSIRLEQIEQAADIPRRAELVARWAAVLAAVRSMKTPAPALTNDELEGLRRLAEIPDGAWCPERLTRANDARPTEQE